MTDDPDLRYVDELSAVLTRFQDGEQKWPGFGQRLFIRLMIENRELGLALLESTEHGSQTYRDSGIGG